jgi:hypothetical protein
VFLKAISEEAFSKHNRQTRESDGRIPKFLGGIRKSDGQIRKFDGQIREVDRERSITMLVHGQPYCPHSLRVIEMSVEEMLKIYDLFDNSILKHGFTAYMRDYQIVAELLSGEHQGIFSYLFRGCVEAHYESSIPEGAFLMDDALIDCENMQSENVPAGFIWSVKSAEAYPGCTYVANSERAVTWSKKIGLPMHEVEIETNVYNLSLVFHDLVVEKSSGL